MLEGDSPEKISRALKAVLEFCDFDNPGPRTLSATLGAGGGGTPPRAIWEWELRKGRFGETHAPRIPSVRIAKPLCRRVDVLRGDANVA